MNVESFYNNEYVTKYKNKPMNVRSNPLKKREKMQYNVTVENNQQLIGRESRITGQKSCNQRQQR